MNLPLPRSRSGLLAAIFLTLVFFALYYGLAYPFINKLYEGDEGYYKDITFNTECIDNDCKIKVLFALAPNKAFSEKFPGYVYVDLRNDSDVEQEIGVSLAYPGEKILHLPAYYQADIMMRHLEVKVPPHTTVHLRFLLNISIKKDQQLDFWVNSKPTSEPTSDPISKQIYVLEIESTDDFLPAMKRILVENILLPPWSNLLLPVLAFLFAFLAETSNEDRGVEGGAVCTITILGMLQGALVWLMVQIFVTWEEGWYITIFTILVLLGIWWVLLSYHKEIWSGIKGIGFANLSANFMRKIQRRKDE